MHLEDLGYMINHAMFQRNGRAGYLLKPEALRNPDKALFTHRTLHHLQITVGIIPFIFDAYPHYLS